MLTPEELAEYLARLRGRLTKVRANHLLQAIVDEPFRDRYQAVQLDLGILALLIVDPKTQMINRTAMSDTELAKSADAVSAKPFHMMNISSAHKANIIAKAIRSGKMQKTSDWRDLFVPVLNAAEARFNQAAGGIGSSIVVPFATTKHTGALVFDFYQPIENINHIHYKFIDEYTKLIHLLP